MALGSVVGLGRPATGAPAAVRHPATVGIILAGGAARRMGGGDKTLCQVGSAPILSRVIGRIERDCVALALSANGKASRFDEYGLPVLADDVLGRPGPLAGILAGLEWAATQHPTVRWLLSVPGDTPFLPDDLVARLHEHRARDDAEIAYAVSGACVHPTVALWPVAAASRLRHALVQSNVRRVAEFAGGFRAARVEWDIGRVDPFTNINEPADLAAAQALADADP